MTSSDVQDCLHRLQVQGSPAWGLSANERDLIDAARQKFGICAGSSSKEGSAWEGVYNMQ
eukprot:scaffold30930_cov24-Attheya_sp.AAC.1